MRPLPTVFYVKAISRERVDYSSDEVDTIFTAIDTNNSGMIEFSEFVTASMERNLQLS